MGIFIFLALVIMLLLGATAYLWFSDDTRIPDPLPPERSVVIETDQAFPEEKWSLRSARDSFDEMKEGINAIKDVDQKPSFEQGRAGFFSRTGYTFGLMMKEKELITFAVLQWVSIAVGYLLWVQMLDWIPPEVWESTRSSNGGSIADVVLFAWSFVCVGVAAFPLSIFSACMGAVHFLHRQGKESTIAACFQIVLPKVWSLWIFHWIDGWITVKQILNRLPKKNDHRTPAERALSEALYYAWKLGTIGILPGLVTGRGLLESGRQSVSVVRYKFKEVATLRVGYSFMCWIVGISAYIGSFFFFAAFPDLMPKGELSSHVYTFYFWIGVPMLIGVAVVQLFLRPVYVISSCDIFSDYLTERQEKVMLPRPPSKSVSAFVAFLVLVVVLGVVFLFRQELGIMDMLATPYK